VLNTCAEGYRIKFLSSQTFVITCNFKQVTDFIIIVVVIAVIIITIIITF